MFNADPEAMRLFFMLGIGWSLLVTVIPNRN